MSLPQQHVYPASLETPFYLDFGAHPQTPLLSKFDNAHFDPAYSASPKRYPFPSQASDPGYTGQAEG